MATYISNWAGSFRNPHINNAGTILSMDLASAVSWFNNTGNINLNSVNAYANYAEGSFYNGGTFQMYGSGFTTSYTPTMTHFHIQTPDSWTFDFYGNVKVNVNTGGTSGQVNHITIVSPKNEVIDVLGSVNASGYSAFISKITYKLSDGVISVKGLLTYDVLSQVVTGDLTSFGYIDNSGHKYQITGISVNYQQLDTFSSLDSFVKSVMSGNDVMSGTSKADVLRGLDGSDTLKGLPGNDLLVGGKGADTLIGGLGKDTFDFNTTLEIGKGASRDSILDFTHSQHDRIDLSGIDANSNKVGNQAFSFIGSKAFDGKAGEIHFIKGVLSGDTNGDKVADFEMSITLVGGTTLVSQDFFL